jgi:hypothetical protein
MSYKILSRIVDPDPDPDPFGSEIICKFESGSVMNPFPNINLLFF